MTTPSNDFTRGLLEAAPALRAFAITIVGRIDRADDLVQETMLKAWAAHASFQAGSNMKAWLFTILRNTATTQFRRSKREVEDADEKLALGMATAPEQPGHLALDEMRAALAELPDDQREAVLLVGAAGFSYEEAADICSTAVGTIKSRVSRARVALAQKLFGESSAGAK
jgi:RNA polymerase sigma-70 factor (ECF subfamily)